MVDEIILNAGAICHLRSSVGFMGFVEWWWEVEWVEGFPIRYGALVD